MDNISLIPKPDKTKSLPRFVTFKKPQVELNLVSKVGLGLLVVGLVSWLGIYIWAKRIETQVVSLTGDLQQLVSQRDLSLEARLKNLNTVLGIFKGVLDEHLYWSQIFKIIELKTLNAVTFKSFSGGADDTSLVLAGNARDYSSLARQVKTLEDTPGINTITTSDVGLSEQGRIDFQIKVSFDGSILKRK